MKNILFSLAVLMSMFFMTNCSNPKSTTAVADGSETLYQNEWKLAELQGVAMPSASEANLVFTAGKVNSVSGNSGCNRMTGGYELGNDHSIKFSAIATTRMACVDENASSTETKFLDVLSKTTGWSIQDDELLLKNGETILAKLKGCKLPTQEEAKLNGVWELNYISGSRIAFDGLFPDKKPTLIFDLPNPEANGNGGCNGYSCKVKVDGAKINFGDPLGTMMACEGNGEPVYFKTLKTVNAYSISGDSVLTLIMGDIAVMRFAKK